MNLEAYMNTSEKVVSDNRNGQQVISLNMTSTDIYTTVLIAEQFKIRDLKEKSIVECVATISNDTKTLIEELPIVCHYLVDDIGLEVTIFWEDHAIKPSTFNLKSSYSSTVDYLTLTGQREINVYDMNDLIKIKLTLPQLVTCS